MSDTKEKMSFHKWRKQLMEQRREALSRKDSKEIAKYNKSLAIDFPTWKEKQQNGQNA